MDTQTVSSPIFHHLSLVHRANLLRAVEILQEGGCQEVYLFGSAATGRATEQSDLDLAVRGCPRGQFFHLLGQLLLHLDCPVDLVDLDTSDRFVEHIESSGELQRIV